MGHNCQSCSMPFEGEGKYCQYCTNEQGKLKPKAEVLQGISYWLQSLTPEDKKADYMKRAEHFMLAMPAWAED